MPWQPFTPDSGQRKTLREDSPDSLGSREEREAREDRFRRRPSYLEEFDMQPEDKPEENGVVKSPSKQLGPEDPAERRVKEKSSYKKLISNLQSTYRGLTQEQALRAILALRVENNGTLSGMTMLEITEGVIRFVKEIYPTEDRNNQEENSDDADGESSSADDPTVRSERKLEIVESDVSSGAERTEILRIPLVRQKKALALSQGSCQSSTESEGNNSSDDSYYPELETAAQRKKPSPKKKDDADCSVDKTSSPKPRSPRKKIEKVQLSVEDIEAEYPKICRKRKFPSHFSEFSLPHPEPEDPDDVLPRDKKNRAGGKRRRNETEDKENQDVENTLQAGRQSRVSVSPQPSGHGMCGLCGLRFDENSKKVEMTEKTRETGQTFADMLYGLFQDQSLPPSLSEKAKSIELDEGYLCTLCVSYVDQMDVFQKKLSEIRSSILDVFIQKTKMDSENREAKLRGAQSDLKEEAKVPKKRGRPPKPKTGKIVTLSYQSPLKKSENVELNPGEVSQPSDIPEDDNEDLSQKLSVLSGIEIKRVNTETGEESEARLGPARKEEKIKKNSPAKKKIPSSVTSPGFVEACESLEEDLRSQTETTLVTPSRANVPFRGRRVSSARGRGQGRGRGTPIPTAVPARPTPPVAGRSKKSLFELSQEKRRSASQLGRPIPVTPVTPQYIVNGIQLSSSPTNSVSKADSPLYSVAVTPSVLPSANSSANTSAIVCQTPEQLKQKKAYRKLVARIQGVHPELSTDEAIQGIIAVRDSNNGTLTGMSMQEIISRVRDTVQHLSAATEVESAAAPIGEEFEKMVFAPLKESEMAVDQTNPIQMFEMKCHFCSRIFKSSSDEATKRVYEIHLKEHEVENRNVYDGGEDNNTAAAAGENAQTALMELIESESQVENSSSLKVESPDRASVSTQPAALLEPDPVRSEISYCKICMKQFKNAKLYGIHQNTEHGAEKEFEKISNSS